MVEFSICGMCKHFDGDPISYSCPAYPNGRDYKECFPTPNQECGNGYHFEAKNEEFALYVKEIFSNVSETYGRTLPCFN